MRETRKRALTNGWVLGDDMKSLLRAIVAMLGGGAAGDAVAKAIARSSLVATAKGVFIVTLVLENGVSWVCGIKCMNAP